MSPAGSLPADTFALAAGRVLSVLRVWADTRGESLLGTVRANADGTWPRQQLAKQETSAIYVTGVDAAGNESTPVKIESTEWVASPAAAGLPANPNRVMVTTQAREALEDPMAREWPSPESNGIDAASIIARPGLDAAPSPREDHAMAYQFGGRP